MTGRFDTMLTTAMALADGRSDDRSALTAAWRQIVDVVAQAGHALSASARSAAFAQLVALNPEIDVRTRRFAAASLAGRTSDLDMVTFFARDLPTVAAPILSAASLDLSQWLALVPELPTTARNLLRHRRDLPREVVDLLARYAPGDLALPDDRSGAPAVVGSTAIQDLVERIAEYRQRAPERPDFKPREAEPVSRTFLFEAGLDGLIDWVEGIARAAVIGIDLAQPAAPSEAGVDGGAAGAWRRRAPFRAARLVIAGTGEAGGNWLIDAAPLFNPRDGRFLGYRGEARRPEPGEIAVGSNSHETPVDTGSLRQLVHELRTPLNAISGFAAMIDGQMLGPAAHAYRTRAHEIVTTAQRLTDMIDDLDAAARTDLVTLDAGAGGNDLSAIVADTIDSYRARWAQGGVDVALHGDAVHTRIAARSVAAMVARLIAGIAAVTARGSTLSLQVALTGGMATLIVGRPASLAGQDERALLDPQYSPEGDWPDAPLLGLGFTLRLVAKLAGQAGGALRILPDRFELALPMAAAGASEAAS